MRTIGDPSVLQALLVRLQRVTPDATRRWGTLTAHEMLCHLGDATDMVLGVRPRDRPVPDRARSVLKWLALWSPIRWPHGWQTNPMHDPRREGTRPSSYHADLARVCASLTRLSQARAGTLEPAHGVFGRMTVADWHRWAYKHVDHHLRQFGA